MIDGPPMGAPGTGASNGSPLPLWLAPVVQITTQVGVPTVFAGILLYFVLFRLDTALKIIEKSEEDRVQVVAAMQDTLVAALDRQADRFEKTIRENIAANKDLAARYYAPPPTTTR